jgi:hypothetical protein
MRKTLQTPTEPVDYPAGTFLKTQKGYFYIVNSSKRYRITSARVLESWRPHRVVATSEAAVANYRIAAKMKFRNGSLIWNLSDGKLYLIENGKRRWVKSPDAFERIGVAFDRNQMPKEAQVVSADEITLHEMGEDLN